MAAFGVHFGTCSACLAVYKDGKTDVVANDLGDRVTPCVVAFTEHEVTVGAAAKQGIIRNASNTVSQVKRVLGRNFDDPVSQAYISSCPVKILKQDTTPVFEVDCQGRKQQIKPSKIAEIIYRKMLETAQSHGGSGIQDAVLAVPGDFTAEQRNAVSEAATKAGFNVLRVINECSAAALAYDLGQVDNSEEYNVLVYRLGGTSHEATVLQIQNGMYRILASCNDHSFGADHFTEILQKHLASEFQRMYRSDPLENKRAAAKLLLSAEVCKHTLSNLTNAQCAVDSLHDGIDFHCPVSRARFESLCSTILPQCTQLIQSALTEAVCSKQDIMRVVLCGGGARMPLVQRVISDFFPASEQLTSVSGDEVIAIGAAKEAAILVGKEDSQLLEMENQTSVQCLSKAVAIRVNGEKEDNSNRLQVIFPIGSLIPSRQQHTATLTSTQTSFVLEVYEAGDTDSLGTAQKLGKIVMRDLPAGAVIKTNFHLKREGDLHITSHDVTSGHQESISIGASSSSDQS
ncbi:hypothetical protein C0Q70_14845 [Pomacea canaliculata]|uniref:Heat shock 70 kDa protein 14 n=1 Tax=Pomacea canaliculata TaxID=400727 RepID=A0A2T7NT78_POMCA|nr:heat shock 70 kDa protein 14-like [Pomacea canaliculata]PVD24364.1 hypothetical protein C0Q70_14845 [Pomacea canaliculata]